MARGWKYYSELSWAERIFVWQRGNDEWVNDQERQGYYSRWGFEENRYALGPLGVITHGRTCGGEAPNINAVAYFVRESAYFVGVTFQVRPFADTAFGVPADPPMKFAQPVMGFNEKSIGKTAASIFESGASSASREALEEAGVKDIVSIQSMGQHWGNPTGPLVTPTDLFEIEVNPDTIDTNKIDREELIYKCEYILVEELMRRIALGEHEGVNYRASVAMNTFFVFLSRHPEALVQASS